MSHFSHITTKLAEKTYLMQALRQLGYKPQEGKLDVRGFRGARTQVDILVRTKHASYDIGFRKDGAHYACVADWFGLRDIQQEAFLQSLTQHYAAAAVKHQLAAKGFAITEERKEDGRLHLLLRRSA